MITAAAIVKIAPAARPYADELAAQMAESGIMANRRRASAFLGQIAVESAGFTSVMENLSYSEQRIRELDAQSRVGSRWHSLGARAKELARNPKALAEAAYGGRMGNGPEGSGDGYAFRGRGLKQLTGKDNYRRFSLSWLGDESLLKAPDHVAEADGAVASAVWFWLANGLNEIADRGDVRAVTIKVNGGTFGLRDREIWTDRFSKAWQDKPDFSRVISGANTVPGVKR